MIKKIKELLTFEVGIVEHCNLNCRGCSHFSPIASPYYMDLDVFKKDIKRLSELFNGTAEWIHIMGGEPLLHPLCSDFLIETRRFFPHARIDLITNAILLLQQPVRFWEICYQQQIVVKPTRYPISLDFDKIIQTAQLYNVSFRFYNHEDEGSDKKLSKYILDPSGHQNQQYSFDHCAQANACITLREGKMYTCPTIPYSLHFSRYFNIDLPISEEDYTDIYKVSSGEELLCRMATAPPFCRFCDHDSSVHGMPWGVSKRVSDEWLITSR